MKLFILVFLAAFYVHAEEAGDTTIVVKKSTEQKPATKYETHDGSEEIVGEKNVLKKEAEKNWKKACAEWSKDFKEHNKGNIISFSCGYMKCDKDGVESTCSSHSKYKLRLVSEHP